MKIITKLPVAIIVFFSLSIFPLFGQENDPQGPKEKAAPLKEEKKEKGETDRTLNLILQKEVMHGYSLFLPNLDFVR